MNRIITIAGLCIIGFCVFALTAMGMYSLVTGKSLEPVTIVVGSLSSLMTLIVGYFWGSSQGSKDKTALMGGALTSPVPPSKGEGSTASDAPVPEVGKQVSLVADVAVGLMIVFLAGIGCRTVKQSTSDVATVVVDTSKVVATEVKQTDSLYHSHYVQDTAVGIAGADINVVLENIPPTPFEGGGVAQPSFSDQDTTVHKDNLTLHAYKDRQGRQHIECRADSLTLVIKRLQVDSVRQSYVYDSAYSAYQKDLYTRKEVVTAKTVVEYPRWKLVCLFLGGLVPGVFIGWVATVVVMKVKRGLTVV